ncbi:MAG: hypothetical protein COB02_09145 [Candidatus Cloacimonadota bacterium]|nr:MAG: hypothetical protein COB02_09145 [Candidatus Cloacimonadota bacterium]
MANKQIVSNRLGIYTYMHHMGIRRLRVRNSTVYKKMIDSNEWEKLSLDSNPVYGFLLLTDLILGQMGHEDFYIFYEKIENSNETFRGILSIYSRDLGPAIAGIRVNSYDAEEDMVEDAVMCSRTTARKAAFSGLKLGGAQFVVDHNHPSEVAYNDPSTFPLLEKIGKIIDEFQGQVIASPDLNTGMHTMHIIQRTTNHVLCNVDQDSYICVEDGRQETGSFNGSGDPSIFTAYSVFQSLKRATFSLTGSPSLKGKKVLVIGLGKCGISIIDLLLQEGAILFGADIDSKACQIIEELYPVKIVARNINELNDAYSMECFAILPCAGGGIISEKRIQLFNTKIICGAANNQLNTDMDAVLLHDKDILYIPDFISNCGGLINAAQEVSKIEDKIKYRQSYDEKEVYSQIDKVGESLAQLLEDLKLKNISPYELSQAKADLKMQDKRKLRWINYVSNKL